MPANPTNLICAWCGNSIDPEDVEVYNDNNYHADDCSELSREDDYYLEKYGRPDRHPDRP